MPASTSSSERNVRLVLEYDGTDLVGWQRQANGPSVQQHLEEALAQMVAAPVAAVGASRTDSGVHALGQVASFRTTSTIPVHGFRLGLNALLPPAIAVVAADEVPPDFHARFSARGKRYRYTILNRPERSPLARHRSWHRARPLDLEAMRAGAGHLVGEHDFSAFRAAGCSAHTSRRQVTGIDITTAPHPPGSAGAALVHIEVRGNAFLRNMVRIIVGTLAEVGAGRLAAAEVAAILASGERDRAGPTAPPQGLTLVEVFYDSPVPTENT